MDHMGHQHDSEPVTAYDRVMSKRHKAHRREVDAMPEGESKLKQSIKYNQAHAMEHQKAQKKAIKSLKKMHKNMRKG